MKKSNTEKNKIISANAKMHILVFCVSLLVSFLWIVSLSQTGLEAADMLKFSHADQVSEKLMSQSFIFFILFFSLSYSLAFIFPRIFKKRISQTIFLGNLLAIIVTLSYFDFSMFFFLMGIANAIGLFQTSRTSEKISTTNFEENKMFSFASNTIRDGLFFFTFLSVFAAFIAFMPYQEEFKTLTDENFLDFLKISLEDSMEEQVTRQDVLSELAKQPSFQNSIGAISDPEARESFENCTIESTLAFSSITQSKMTQALSSPQLLEKIKQDTPLRFFYDFLLIAMAFSVMVIISMFSMIFGFIATTYLLVIKYLVKIFSWLKKLE